MGQNSNTNKTDTIYQLITLRPFKKMVFLSCIYYNTQKNIDGTFCVLYNIFTYGQ